MEQIDIAEVREWARAGGAIALRYFNNVNRQRKADHSWVTQADLEIEAFLREQITRQYPAHGIIGEEHGIMGADREFVWALDPIDGTGAFVAGLPLWCVSIGVLRVGEPYLGVIYFPLLDDCYYAAVSSRAYRNDEVIRAFDGDEYDRINDWIAVPSNAHRNYQITFSGKTRAIGSIAADLCYVARGSAIGALIGRARIWDMAAGLMILSAAGGVIQTLSGQPFDPRPYVDGRRLAEPMFIAPPQLIDRLLQHISRLPR